MGLGGKIMAGIALIVIAMVIKRYMKKEEKNIRETNRKIRIYDISSRISPLPIIVNVAI
jgi:hypothetical protein